MGAGFFFKFTFRYYKIIFFLLLDGGYNKNEPKRALKIQIAFTFTFAFSKSNAFVLVLFFNAFVETLSRIDTRLTVRRGKNSTGGGMRYPNRTSLSLWIKWNPVGPIGNRQTHRADSPWSGHGPPPHGCRGMNSRVWHPTRAMRGWS